MLAVSRRRKRGKEGRREREEEAPDVPSSTDDRLRESLKKGRNPGGAESWRKTIRGVSTGYSRVDLKQFSLFDEGKTHWVFSPFFFNPVDSRLFYDNLQTQYRCSCLT